ncbi:MAG: type IV secretory system conjugative DNA transfer family protein [Ktedonobacteraceae bacterium]
MRYISKYAMLIVTTLLILCMISFFIWFLSPGFSRIKTDGFFAVLIEVGQRPDHALTDPKSKLPTTSGTILLILLALTGIRLWIADKWKTSKVHGSAKEAKWNDTRQYRAPRNFTFASTAPATPPASTALVPVRSPKRGRKPEQWLVLGRYLGQTISLSQKQQQENVILTAPIGAGKTVLIILRNLLREVGLRSLFIADVKAELVRKSAGYLSQFYTVWIFSPGRAATSNGYNPLAHVNSIREAQALADCWLANTGTNKNDDFWMKATRRLFVATILHLRTTEPRAPFHRLAEILSGMTYEELKSLLTTSHNPTARTEAKAAFDGMDKNERMAGGIMADMGTRFDLLMDSEIQKATSYNDINFTAMAEKPVVLFLSIPPRDTERCHALMAVFTMQMFSAWEARAETTSSGQLPLPIQCYLDEFANLGKIYGLTGHLTTMRHIGVGLLIVLQAFSQLDERYGMPIRKTVLTNCTTHLLLPGSGLEECEYYSARIGDTTVETHSKTSKPTGYWSTSDSYTTGETRRRLFTPDELRTMKAGTIMVLGSSSQVMMVQATPWYEDKETRSRGDTPFTHTSVYVDEEPEDSVPSGKRPTYRNPMSLPKPSNAGRVVDADLSGGAGSGFSPE